MKACFWFVHPLDADTNTVIANLFEGRTDDHLHFDKECKDGVRRHLWECPHDRITHLKANTKSLGLRFEVFRRRGLYGPIEQWSGSKSVASESSLRVTSQNHRSSGEVLVVLAQTCGVVRGTRLAIPPQVG